MSFTVNPYISAFGGDPNKISCSAHSQAPATSARSSALRWRPRGVHLAAIVQTSSACALYLAAGVEYTGHTHCASLRGPPSRVGCPRKCHGLRQRVTEHGIRTAGQKPIDGLRPSHQRLMTPSTRRGLEVSHCASRAACHLSNIFESEVTSTRRCLGFARDGWVASPQGDSEPSG